MQKIYVWEPWFFMFFGVFHLHRRLIDRTSYADFWIGILENKGMFYFVLMGILAFLCICGIVLFCKNIKNNYWWRWIYIFGGGYLLFDLFSRTQRAKRKLACTWRLRAGQIPRPLGRSLLRNRKVPLEKLSHAPLLCCEVFDLHSNRLESME